MKYTILLMMVTLFLNAGFFNEQSAKDRAEFVENDRLCKVFTKKVEVYKAKMRDDLLAKVSLASYMHRKDLFCKKAKEAKESLESVTIMESNITL